MIDAIGGVTADIVRLALDAAQLRHTAISNNIANANTPGYTRQKVNFEDQLVSASAALRTGSNAPGLSSLLGSISPVLAADTSTGADLQGGVELEREMAELAKNVVRYEALLKGLGKEMSILSIAINEGRK